MLVLTGVEALKQHFKSSGNTFAFLVTVTNDLEVTVVFVFIKTLVHTAPPVHVDFAFRFAINDALLHWISVRRAGFVYAQERERELQGIGRCTHTHTHTQTNAHAHGW
jgi:hypothetical protein